MAARLALIYAAAVCALLGAAGFALGRLAPPQPLASPLPLALGAAFVLLSAATLYFLALRYLVTLRASQERYRRLFEQAPEGLIILRVELDERGGIADLVVEAVNATQAGRSLAAPAHILGASLRNADEAGDRMRAYFDVACRAIESDRPLRTDVYIPSEDVTELVGAYPIEPGVWALSAVDITDVRRAERASHHEERRIHRAYVDVISAVTGGKLILLSEQALADQLGLPLTEATTIRHTVELAEARRRIVAAVAARHPDWQAGSRVLNPVSEALNNALKHASSCTFQAFVQAGTLQICVTDDGPGIDFRTLPKATLIPGYSTAESLGMGFTIMLHLCERVLLCTYPGRTQVVLETPLEAQPAQQRLQQAATRRHIPGETRDRVAP